MKLHLFVEGDGEEFTYECTSEEGKGLRIWIDGEEVQVNLVEIHELGLLIKRQASFCKSRAKSSVFESFEDNWFVNGNRRVDD